MSEDSVVLPDEADDAWSGGLDDAGQSTARAATAGPGSAATGRPATGRPATESGTDAGTCLERDQARSKHARAQLPGPGRCHQDATRGWGPDLANNAVDAATAAGPAVGSSLISCWTRLRSSVRQSESGILDPSASGGFSGRYGCRRTSHPSRPAMLEEKVLPDLLCPERCLL